EELTAKLQAMVFAAKRDTLGQGEIEIGEARAGENVAPFRAKSRTKRFRGRLGECTLVKPVLWRPHLSGGLASWVRRNGSGFEWVSYKVGPLRVAESRGGGGGSSRQNHGKGGSRLRREDSSRLPVIQQSPAPARTLGPNAAEWQVVDEAQG